MDNSTLKNIFKFIEDEGEHKAPFKWKLENNIPLSKEELNVKGNVNLGSSKIKSLPKDLEVYGHLNLYGSKIESLPEELYVARTLSLTKCKNLTSLPKGLKVGEHLLLSHCPIKFLPEGLQVGSSLYIVNTPLTNYSDDELREMVKPGFIKGYIIRG